MPRSDLQLKHECYKAGGDAEYDLMVAMTRAGHDVSKASTEENIHDHYDLVWRVGDGFFGLDVKTFRREGLSKVAPDEVYLELRNVKGKHGWLYGKSHFIVWKTSEEWIFVPRRALLHWVRWVIGEEVGMKNLVTYPTLYKLYSRAGRQDILTVVKLEDLKLLSVFTLSIQ